MKFAAYQRVVTPNTINPPAYRAPSDVQVYGAGGKEFDSLGGALGQMNKVALKIQDDADSSALMDARNKIMTRLTDGLYGEEGLFTTGVGENAPGLTERTHDFIQETFDDVIQEGKYNGRVRQALQGNLNENFNNYQRIAASQESREREVVDTDNYNGALNLAEQNAGLTWNVNGSLTNAQKDVETIVMAHGMKYGWSGMKIQSEIRKAKTANTVSAYNAAVAEGDFDRANDILKYNRKDMDQNTWNQMHSSVKKHEEVQKVHDVSQNIFDACYDSKTGNFDWTKAKQMARENSYHSVAGGADSGANRSVPRLWNIAVETANILRTQYGLTKANPDFLYGQMMIESTLGTDPTALQNNNFAGLYGGAAGKSYADDHAFAKDYAEIYANNPAYVRAVQSATATEYVDNLISGNYFTATDKRDGYIRAVDEYGNEGKSAGIGDATPNYNVSGANLDNINPTFNQKVSIWDNWVYSQTGEHVTVTSGNDGTHDDQNHYNGNAVDVVLDNFHDDNFRAQAIAKAQELGIRVYDEYDHSNWTGNTTGDNMHLSNTDQPLPTSAAASSESVYDPEQEDKIMKRVQSLVNDANVQFKQNHADMLNNIEIAAKNAGSYTAACDIIDQQVGLTMSESNSLKSQARSYYGVSITGKPLGSRNTSSSRQYVYGNSGARYTQNQINDAESNYEEYQERMADPDDTISRTDQRRYNKAARILNDANGTTGDNLDSDDGLKMARHAVEVTANDEEAEWYLISNYQYSETEAEAYVAMVHGSPEDE